MLHFGKIPKKFGQNLAKKAKFWRILQNFAKIYKKKQQKNSAFLTKKLRLENGAKECIV
jgi:hypothetical protein